MREITPKRLFCAVGTCPSVFEVDEHNVVIVGQKLTPEMKKKIGYKIGENEYAILIRKEYIREVE
jgi:hypothetical protein